MGRNGGEERRVKEERFLTLNGHTETIQTSGTLKVTLMSYNALLHPNTHTYRKDWTFPDGMKAHISVAAAWKINSCINVRHLFRTPLAHANPSGSKFAYLPMTSPTNDSGACLTDVYAKRSLKSSQTFSWLRLCVRMLWKLHVSMATRLIPEQVVFFCLERHG